MLLHGDCRKFMFDGTIPAESVDLVVTSPPYDNLRTYSNDVKWNLGVAMGVISGLDVVVKDGGVVVWIVADSTNNGAESGTSFRHAQCFMEAGFILYDTMIWRKPNAPPYNHPRYDQAFEYMFVFSKGKPNTVNLIKTKCKKAGTVQGTSSKNIGDQVNRQ